MEKFITGALHQAKRISSDFDNDVKQLEQLFLNAGYPKRFISHAVNSFLKSSQEDDVLITRLLFEERNTYKLCWCNTNELLNKTFISKLNNCAGFNHILFVLWQTREIKAFSTSNTKTLIDHMWSMCRSMYRKMFLC